MATYLPNITDVFPEPVNVQLDINFFDKMLQRKQSLYDQGVSRAKSAFDSVLNAPLSNKFNIPLRDQYINEAKQELKKISASDFSMPENVTTAQNIFSPFWDDEFMLKDSALTKWYQSQGQKLAGWRNDNDPKTKEQYNGIAMEYLNTGLEKLKNADRSSEAYAKIEKREAIPFTNIEKYLDDEAKNETLKIQWDQQSPDGAYLVSSINGERSKQKFGTWAQSKIGNNFYEQFRVTGIVEKERRFKNIKKDLPNLTDEQALDIMSTDVVKELGEGYKKREQNISVEETEIMSILKSMPSTLDEQQKQLVDKLNQDLRTLGGKKDALNKSYQYFNQEDKSKILEQLKIDPDSYFATLAKQRIVDNWSTGRASMEGRELKENSAFFKAQDIQLKTAELNRNIKNDEWNKQKDIWNQNNKLTELQQKEWELTHPKPTAAGTTGTGKTKTIKDANGNDIVVADDGADPISTGRYIGLGTTGDITATVQTAAEVYTRTMDQLYTSAHNLIYDPKGLLYVTKKGLNMSDSDLALISSAMKNEVEANNNPNVPNYKFTKEQNNAAARLNAALNNSAAVQNAGIKITAPATFRQAIIAYGQDYFNKRLELAKDGNNVPLDKNEFGAMMSYLTSVQNLDTYTANEANRQQLLKKVLKENPDYKNIIVDHNGQKDILAPSDIAKDMPTLELRPYGDPNPKNNLKLSKQDVASRYIKGELSQASEGDIFLDNKKYMILKTNNEEGVYDGPVAWNNIYNKMLVPKYGTSKDFSDKVKKANSDVVPDLLFYRDRTGRLGSEFSYTFDKKTQEDKAFNILNEALSPANADIYGADGKQVDKETMAALRALLQNKEENVEKYIQGYTYKTLGIDGKQTISFNIGEVSAETKQQIGGVNLDKLNQQQYSLVISPTATGPTLTSLPNNTGMYVYQNLLRGKPMKCDPVIAASGFNFTLTPNSDGSTGSSGQANTPTAVTLNLKYNVRENVTDPKTRQLTSVIKEKSQDIDIPLSGANSKSPDEIVNYLYQLYQETMANNRNVQQQYQQYLETPTNNSGSVSNPNNPSAPAKPTTFDRDQYYRSQGINIK